MTLMTPNIKLFPFLPSCLTHRGTTVLTVQDQTGNMCQSIHQLATTMTADARGCYGTKPPEGTWGPIQNKDVIRIYR